MRAIGWVDSRLSVNTRPILGGDIDRVSTGRYSVETLTEYQSTIDRYIDRYISTNVSTDVSAEPPPHNYKIHDPISVDIYIFIMKNNHFIQESSQFHSCLQCVITATCMDEL